MRRIDERRIEISERWNVAAEVLAGFRLRPIGRPDTLVAMVSDYAADRSILTLDRPVTIDDGDAFELATGEEAPVLAARLMTATPEGRTLPPCEMRLATTLATNALLERTGEATALFVTRGFEDLSRIGTQQRPHLFVLDVRKAPPLHAAVVGVEERLAADGSVIRAINLDAASAAAETLFARGIRSAAIAFMHAFRNPEHERRLAERLERLGFEHVASSAELAPRIKLLPRLETAVVDAYLGPLIQGYLGRVSEAAGDAMKLLVMTSAGGLNDAAGHRAKDSLLSGPAGGVVGATRAGLRHGRSRLIA